MADETNQNPSTEPVEPLARFDFGSEVFSDEEPDFKAMAEAFQEFARKAMAVKPRKDDSEDAAEPE